MPPMGPFLDNVLWIGVLGGLIFLAFRAVEPDRRRKILASSKDALTSIVDIIAPPKTYGAGGQHASNTVATGNDTFDRWCASELKRIADEQRRLESRRQDLFDLAAGMRTHDIPADQAGAASSPST